MMSVLRKAFFLAVVLTLGACSDDKPEEEPSKVDESILAERMGDPMQGATSEELEAFERGKAVAERR